MDEGFTDMERQIQALLDGGAQDDAPAVAEQPATTAVDAPAVDVRAEALEPEPVDPLLREIDAALSDDADALLRGSGGDIAGAVRSVFDERALSGQEEEINRALIEAFGTSRVERPSFQQPSVTNPLPGFDGAARPLPPDIPREERDREPAPEADFAKTAEPTPTPTVAPRAQPVAMDAPQAATAEAPRPEPVHAAPAEAARSTPATQAAATEPARTSPVLAMQGIAMQAILIPLRILAAPFRMVPVDARPVLTIAAITLLACAPVAWWLAQRAAATPLVGPITIVPAPAVASAEPSSGH